jgi:hypothetical protein
VRAYRRTLRRNRPLLIAPIVISAVVAGWFTFGAAPTYRSTASLWVDNGSSIASSMETGSGSASETAASQGPAGFEDDVLNELLSTPQFDVAVAHRSALTKFLAAGGSAGGFSPTVLLHRSGGSPESEAAVSVSTGVRSVVAGPQVLLLSYEGPSPAVAQSVVRAVVKELATSAFSTGDTIGKTAAAFYQRKVSSATWAVSNTRAALATYARNHLNATSANDPTYAALAAQVQVANANLASIETVSAEAETEATGSAQATMAVIDRPSLPAGPVTGLGSQISGVLAGAFAGLVLSLLTLIILTPRPAMRWDAEMPFFDKLNEQRSRRRPQSPPQRGEA